jgi:hypothetical protein
MLVSDLKYAGYQSETKKGTTLNLPYNCLVIFNSLNIIYKTIYQFIINFI